MWDFKEVLYWSANDSFHFSFSRICEDLVWGNVNGNFQCAIYHSRLFDKHFRFISLQNVHAIFWYLHTLHNAHSKNYLILRNEYVNTNMLCIHNKHCQTNLFIIVLPIIKLNFNECLQTASCNIFISFTVYSTNCKIRPP